MTYLQLPDKDFVHPVPLLAGPADQQAFPAHLLLQSQVTENLQRRVVDPLFLAKFRSSALYLEQRMIFKILLDEYFR